MHNANSRPIFEVMLIRKQAGCIRTVLLRCCACATFSYEYTYQNLGLFQSNYNSPREGASIKDA